MFVFFTAGFCLYAQTLAWDIKFLMGKEQESVPISRQIRMETDETFLITVKPDADCFCYVVFYDSDRKISVLRDAPITGGIEVPLIVPTNQGADKVVPSETPTDHSLVTLSGSRSFSGLSG